MTKKFLHLYGKVPKIYKSFSKIDKNSSKINKNLPKINRICQKLTKIRQNQRKFVENHLKFGTKIWHCHPSSPKNFPVLCRFFKISSSKKRHKSGTRLYVYPEFFCSRMIEKRKMAHKKVNWGVHWGSNELCKSLHFLTQIQIIHWMRYQSTS